MMNRNKVVIGMAAAALAVTLTITAVVTKGEKDTKPGEVTATELERNGIAGISEVLRKEQKKEANPVVSSITVEKELVDMVAEPVAPVQKEEAVEPEKKEDTKEGPKEKTLTAEEQEWQDKLMADVKDYMNIRAEADEEAKIVGKLRKGDRALIKEQGEAWTRIASGNAVGYVKNEYCVFGLDALDYAKKNCDTIATVNTNSLRVRKEAGTDAKIVKMVGKGERLKVATGEETVDGWIAVEAGGEICYVSAEYVTVGRHTTKAITIEEEKAAKKAAAGGLASGQTTTTSTTPGHTLAATADEETLLAAIAECEAGSCGEECMTAVAAVVINRIHSSAYPDNMYDVIYQRSQFSPASSGRLEQRLARGPSESARRAARAALAGADPTGGAIGFKLASSGHPGVVIGPIVFF